MQSESNKEEVILLDLCKQCTNDDKYELIELALENIKDTKEIDSCLIHLLRGKSNSKTVELLFEKGKCGKRFSKEELFEMDQCIIKMEEKDKELSEKLEQELKIEKGKEELYIKYIPGKIDHSAIFKLINDNNIKL